MLTWGPHVDAGENIFPSDPLLLLPDNLGHAATFLLLAAGLALLLHAAALLLLASTLLLTGSALLFLFASNAVVAF